MTFIINKKGYYTTQADQTNSGVMLKCICTSKANASLKIVAGIIPLEQVVSSSIIKCLEKSTPNFSFILYIASLAVQKNVSCFN